MQLKNTLLSKSVKLLSYTIIGGLILSASPALADQTVNPSLNSEASSTTSYNWAGYISTGGTFTSVGGTWTVPQPENSSNFSADATWIGIGGISSSDLIQTGTEAIISSSGQIIYQAWYELLPNTSQAAAITINPGDSITASITQTQTGQWAIMLTDNTNGQNFQTVVSYDSSLSSAEWIEEMPSSTGGFIPLDNFGTAKFYNGWAVKDGTTVNISESQAQTITMLNASNEILASPSAIGTDGGSFTVTRTTAAVSDTSSVIPYSPPAKRNWPRPGMGLKGYNPDQNQERVPYNHHGFSQRKFSFSEYFVIP